MFICLCVIFFLYLLAPLALMFLHGWTSWMYVTYYYYACTAWLFQLYILTGGMCAAIWHKVYVVSEIWGHMSMYLLFLWNLSSLITEKQYFSNILNACSSFPYLQQPLYRYCSICMPCLHHEVWISRIVIVVSDSANVFFITNTERSFQLPIVLQRTVRTFHLVNKTVFVFICLHMVL
jgi:hypothetical protein